MLIGLYEFGVLEGPELDTFLDHLIECEYCYEQVYDMEPFMEAIREHREAVQRGEIEPDYEAFGKVFQEEDHGQALKHYLAQASPRKKAAAAETPPFRLTKQTVVAATLLVAVGAALGAWFLSGRSPATTVLAPTVDVARGGPSPWRDVVVPKPAYAPTSDQHLYRDVTIAFERAMTDYQTGNFRGAAQQLEALSELRLKNAAEVQFYWGVSLLLADKTAEAVAPLHQAAELGVGPQREESQYYLALAYLKSNRPDRALTQLEAVIDMGGAHRAAAESLKRRIWDVQSNR
jgi:hypothetical protein